MRDVRERGSDGRRQRRRRKERERKGEKENKRKRKIVVPTFSNSIGYSFSL